MTDTPKPIPLAVLEPLTKTPWLDDEYSLNQFALALDTHRDEDWRWGSTCYYTTERPETVTAAELRKMFKAGAIAPHHVAGDCRFANQHLIHSLNQFYAEVTKAWADHQNRMASIRGTPSDRIKAGVTQSHCSTAQPIDRQ